MLSGAPKELVSPVQGPDQDLSLLKKHVLDNMRSTLVENIDPTKFLPFLRSKFVVNDRENAEIKSSCSRSVYEGADKLIDVLCTKGARGYDIFCEAIHHDQTQLYLLTGLNKRLEQLRYSRNQQVRRHIEAARLQQAQEQQQHQQQHQQQLEHQRYLMLQRQQREQSAVHPFNIHPQQGGHVVGSPSTTGTGTSSYAYAPVHVPRPSPGDAYHGGSGVYARCPDSQPPSSSDTLYNHSNMLEGRGVQDTVSSQLWPREGATGQPYPSPLPELSPTPGIGTYPPETTPGIGTYPPEIGYFPPYSTVDEQECSPCGQPQ